VQYVAGTVRFDQKLTIWAVNELPRLYCAARKPAAKGHFEVPVSDVVSIDNIQAYFPVGDSVKASNTPFSTQIVTSTPLLNTEMG
jgi:hypothetical protein